MAGIKRITEAIKKANKKVKKQRIAKVKKAKNIDGNVTRRKAARLVSKPLPVSEPELNEADREYFGMEEGEELESDMDMDLGEDFTSEPDDTDYELPDK